MSDPDASARPTAVDRQDRSPRVVVGVDGSPGSRAALVYALTAAARRGAELEVVCTYSIQALWVGGYPLGVPAVATIRESTEFRIVELVKQVRDDVAVRGVPGTADVPTTV